MSQPTIVGLGLTTLDVLLRAEQLPTWGNPTPVASFALDGGGMVGTAMVAAARLGGNVGYIGVRGTDLVAEIKMRTLIEDGVDTSRILTIPGPEREVIIVHVDAHSGERMFCGLSGSRDPLYPPSALDRDYIVGADLLLVDGFHIDAALQAADWMRAAGKTVVMDGSKTDGRPPAHRCELVEHVDILICGSGFVQGLTGLVDPIAACRAALDLGPRMIVQTLGEQGSVTVTRDKTFGTPAFDVEVVDTTGAGDVFHGAYLVGLERGWPPERIARFATAVSALKCTRLGGRAGIPTFSQTIKFLIDHDVPWDEE